VVVQGEAAGGLQGPGGVWGGAVAALGGDAGAFGRDALGVGEGLGHGAAAGVAGADEEEALGHELSMREHGEKTEATDYRQAVPT
jgi:hypothetical protein